jgi:hypothetical protein
MSSKLANWRKDLGLYNPNIYQLIDDILIS